MIRATHRGVASNGEYVGCLDAPHSAHAGYPMQTWHFNGGDAQEWVQIYIGNTPDGQVDFVYSPYLDNGLVLQFNNGDAASHLVLVPPFPFSTYQVFQQDYCCTSAPVGDGFTGAAPLPGLIHSPWLLGRTHDDGGDRRRA